MLTEADASVWAAGIAGLASTVSALFAYRANKNAKESNDAVNHRHLHGTPRLYDIVLELQNWMHRWQDMPTTFNDGKKLTDTLLDLQHQLTLLDHKITSHVYWEEHVKYNEMTRNNNYNSENGHSNSPNGPQHG